MPIRLKMMDSSLMSAMLTSRWVFSMMLGGLRHLDAAGPVHAGLHHQFIDLGNGLGALRVAAGAHLHDAGQRVLLVARIDPLGL